MANNDHDDELKHRFTMSPEEHSRILSEHEDAARRFRSAMSPEDRERLPYYRHLIDALSSSDTALDLLLSVRKEQQNPMLILAALHYTALLGDPTLAPLYEAAANNIGTSAQDFANAVVAFLEHSPDVIKKQLHRSTQTNEVGRSAIVIAVLRELRRRGVHEINLVDVGMSAGLNLYPDHYRVIQSDDGTIDALICQDLTPFNELGALPVIQKRIGIDPSPLNVVNADDALWLRACLWPEDTRRARRLQALLSEVPLWEPITRLKATAVDAIDEAVALAGDAVPTLVFHSWVAAYFSLEEQRAWRARMLDITRNHPVYWLYLEWPRAIPGIEPPTALTESPQAGGCQIVCTAPGGEPEPWGWCHAHGHWLSFEPSPKNNTA